MIVTRKDINAAIDGVGNDLGDVFVFRPQHKRYEIRATRRQNGIDLKWAKPGKFYNPNINYFRRISAEAAIA